MRTDQRQVLPLYVVADESGSMASVVDEVNTGLVSVHRGLFAEPMAAAKIRMSILGFADRPVLYTRLADFRRTDRLPKLSAKGSTRYGAVFAELLRLIPADILTLQAEGYCVHRPTVFFLTDGRPKDQGWQEIHARLVDRVAFPQGPNIIVCGIGAADAPTILAVASHPTFGFVSVPGAEVGAQIANVFAALTRTVVVTGRSMDSGRTDVTVPQPEGFQLAIDVI